MLLVLLLLLAAAVTHRTIGTAPDPPSFHNGSNSSSLGSSWIQAIFRSAHDHPGRATHDPKRANDSATAAPHANGIHANGSYYQRGFLLVDGGTAEGRGGVWRLHAQAALKADDGAGMKGGPLSVLFIGNSYTFVNDVPSLVQQICASVNVTVASQQQTKGGASLFQHANTSTAVGRQTMQLLRSRRWGVVVLQDQSETAGGGRDTDDDLPPAVGRERTLAALRATYAPALQHSRVILYETWGRKTGYPPNSQCCGYGSFLAMNHRTAAGYEQYRQALAARVRVLLLQRG
jgi:hypothetical protein